MLERVGFIGLGYIGEPMATRLAGRFETTVHDLRPEAVQALVEKGAKPAGNAAELAARSEVVGVCVLDDAGTEAVVAGEGGILEGASEGAVIAIHSTVHPGTVQRLAERAAERGVAVIDAQMTGGPVKAAEGALRFMVGGDEAAFERARPYLDALGEESIHCGALGLGAVAKLCNNMVQFMAWQAFVEAETLAEATGLGREKLRDVLSWIMNENARVMLTGRAALENDPSNQFLLDRFTQTMLLAEKDLSVGLAVARKAGVAMPGIGLCVQQLARLFAVPDPLRR